MSRCGSPGDTLSGVSQDKRRLHPSAEFTQKQHCWAGSSSRCCPSACQWQGWVGSHALPSGCFPGQQEAMLAGWVHTKVGCWAGSSSKHCPSATNGGSGWSSPAEFRSKWDCWAGSCCQLLTCKGSWSHLTVPRHCNCNVYWVCCTGTGWLQGPRLLEGPWIRELPP